jgi:hypothetical protein
MCDERRALRSLFPFPFRLVRHISLLFRPKSPERRVAPFGLFADNLGIVFICLSLQRLQDCPSPNYLNIAMTLLRMPVSVTNYCPKGHKIAT